MQKFMVIPDEGDKYEVTATTRDIAKWEKTNKGATFGSFMRDMKMTDMYKLAYNSATRLGLFEGTLEEFEESCDLEVLEDEEESDPTRSAA